MKEYAMGNGQSLQEMVLGKLDSYKQKIETEPLSQSTHTHTNAKWIKDINVGTEIINLLKANIGSNFLVINFSNIFMDMFPQTREIKAK